MVQKRSGVAIEHPGSPTTSQYLLQVLKKMASSAVEEREGPTLAYEYAFLQENKRDLKAKYRREVEEKLRGEAITPEKEAGRLKEELEGKKLKFTEAEMSLFESAWEGFQEEDEERISRARKVLSWSFGHIVDSVENKFSPLDISKGTKTVRTFYQNLERSRRDRLEKLKAKFKDDKANLGELYRDTMEHVEEIIAVYKDDSNEMRKHERFNHCYQSLLAYLKLKKRAVTRMVREFYDDWDSDIEIMERFDNESRCDMLRLVFFHLRFVEENKTAVFTDLEFMLKDNKAFYNQFHDETEELAENLAAHLDTIALWEQRYFDTNAPYYNDLLDTVEATHNYWQDLDHDYIHFRLIIDELTDTLVARNPLAKRRIVKYERLIPEMIRDNVKLKVGPLYEAECDARKHIVSFNKRRKEVITGYNNVPSDWCAMKEKMAYVRRREQRYKNDYNKLWRRHENYMESSKKKWMQMERFINHKVLGYPLRPSEPIAAPEPVEICLKLSKLSPQDRQRRLIRCVYQTLIDNVGETVDVDFDSLVPQGGILKLLVELGVSMGQVEVHTAEDNKLLLQCLTRYIYCVQCSALCRAPLGAQYNGSDAFIDKEGRWHWKSVCEHTLRIDTKDFMTGILHYSKGKPPSDAFDAYKTFVLKGHSPEKFMRRKLKAFNFELVPAFTKVRDLLKQFYFEKYNRQMVERINKAKMKS